MPGKQIVASVLWSHRLHAIPDCHCDVASAAELLVLLVPEDGSFSLWGYVWLTAMLQN